MDGWIIRLGLFKVAEPFDCFSRGCWNIRWNIHRVYIIHTWHECMYTQQQKILSIVILWNRCLALCSIVQFTHIHDVHVRFVHHVQYTWHVYTCTTCICVPPVYIYVKYCMYSYHIYYLFPQLLYTDHIHNIHTYIHDIYICTHIHTYMYVYYMYTYT